AHVRRGGGLQEFHGGVLRSADHSKPWCFDLFRIVTFVEGNRNCQGPSADCSVTVMGGEVEVPETGTGGPYTGQHGAIAFPEYTAVNVLAPGASCDALSGRLAADVLALVGSSVCVASKVDPSMKFTLLATQTLLPTSANTSA